MEMVRYWYQILVTGPRSVQKNYLVRVFLSIQQQEDLAIRQSLSQKDLTKYPHKPHTPPRSILCLLVVRLPKHKWRLTTYISLLYSYALRLFVLNANPSFTRRLCYLLV